MKNLTDFRKTVETGVDPRLNTVCLHESKLDLIINGNERLALQMKATDSDLTARALLNAMQCVLAMFLNRVFQRERYKRFVQFLASLIKNGGAKRKCYSFSLGIKPFEISAYVSTKKGNSFKILG